MKEEMKNQLSWTLGRMEPDKGKQFNYMCGTHELHRYQQVSIKGSRLKCEYVPI